MYFLFSQSSVIVMYPIAISFKLNVKFCKYSEQYFCHTLFYCDILLAYVRVTNILLSHNIGIDYYHILFCHITIIFILSYIITFIIITYYINIICNGHVLLSYVIVIYYNYILYCHTLLTYFIIRYNYHTLYCHILL